MLVKLAEAIGRLVLAGREMSRLAGFTTRMDELVSVLREINAGKYERTMVSNTASADADIGINKGIISFQDHLIRFDKVPLVTWVDLLKMSWTEYEIWFHISVQMATCWLRIFPLKFSLDKMFWCADQTVAEKVVCSVSLVNFGRLGVER